MPGATMIFWRFPHALLSPALPCDPKTLGPAFLHLPRPAQGLWGRGVCRRMLSARARLRRRGLGLCCLLGSPRSDPPMPTLRTRGPRPGAAPHMSLAAAQRAGRRFRSWSWRPGGRRGCRGAGAAQLPAGPAGDALSGIWRLWKGHEALCLRPGAPGALALPQPDSAVTSRPCSPQPPGRMGCGGHPPLRFAAGFESRAGDPSQAVLP